MDSQLRLHVGEERNEIFVWRATTQTRQLRDVKFNQTGLCNSVENTKKERNQIMMKIQLIAQAVSLIAAVIMFIQQPNNTGVCGDASRPYACAYNHF